jgi:hypothetical protein
LGQLYQQLGYKIALWLPINQWLTWTEKRIENLSFRHAKKAELFDYQNGDFILSQNIW